MSNGFSLPPDLPAPVDDGACTHLSGMPLPALGLVSTTGRIVDLGQLNAFRTILYCYPMTGVPGRALPDGWDLIPGARGCTPQASAFRDRFPQLQELNTEIFGLSTQTPAYQREMAERLQLPFEVLSDAEFKFCDALRLPTFEVDGMRLLKRLTLIVRKGLIEKVFYPIFPPDQNAGEIIRWLGETSLKE